MPYIGRTKDVKVRQQRFICDGDMNIFTLDFVPVSDNQFTCYLDGLFLNDSEFVFKHPNRIFLSDTPADGAELLITCLKASDLQSTRYKSYICNGVQRIYDMGFVPPEEASVIVTKNGDVLQDKDYIIVGGKVVLEQTPASDVKLEIRGLYDVVDPSGNVQASNSLSIQRTRAIADGLQNLIPMHQKPDNENNLIVMYGDDSSQNSKVRNEYEYAIVSTYKYASKSPETEGTDVEFRSLKGSTYTNLARRVIRTKHIDGVPTTLGTISNAGTSGYTTANNLEARNGSGQGLRVNITASGGIVTGVTINTSLAGGDFAYGYNANETVTIIQSGSTNDATIPISAVADREGQRYFDLNNHVWDSQNDTYQKETTYTLSANEEFTMVSIDGILQPMNQYTVMSADFNEGSGASNQVIDVGSYVGVNDQPAIVEIRQINQFTGNDDAYLTGGNLGSNGTLQPQRVMWTTTGASATLDTASGYTARSTAWNSSAFTADLSNEAQFLVIVNGIIQDRDTWSLSGSSLTIGDTVGSSDDSTAGQDVFVELIHWPSQSAGNIASGTGTSDSTLYDCKEVTMTGTATSGSGDHKFIRLLDRATGMIEIHPDSEDVVICDINGVLQNDTAFFVQGNKLCFWDEAPAFGSTINVKVLKSTPVTATNRRKTHLRGDGSTTQFTLPFTSTTTADDFGILVFVNGKAIQDNEYALSGTTLHFSTAPANDAFIEVVGIFDVTTYSGTSSETNLETKRLVVDTDGVQQIFDMGELVFEKHSFGTIQDTYNEQKLMVYLDGELQGHDKYIIIGNKIYFTSVPADGLRLEFVRFI